MYRGNKIAQSCITSGKAVYSLLLIAMECTNAVMHEKSYRPANLPRIEHNDVRNGTMQRRNTFFAIFRLTRLFSVTRLSHSRCNIDRSKAKKIFCFYALHIEIAQCTIKYNRLSYPTSSISYGSFNDAACRISATHRRSCVRTKTAE